MDDVEVRLEEITAKIDQIAYTQVAPRRYYEISDTGKMIPPDKVMENALKSVTGGGIFGGAMAGVMAGTIMVDLLKQILNQSKILNTVTGQIMKALGLAVDLILLPLVPLITWFLMQLYNVILAAFGPKTGGEENKPGAKTVSEVTPWKIPEIMLANIVSSIEDYISRALFGADVSELAKRWSEANLVPITNVLKGLWETFTTDAGVLVNNLAVAFWKTVDDWKKGFDSIWKNLTAAWDSFWGTITGAWETLKKAWDDFWKPISDAITQFGSDLKGIWDTLTKMLSDFISLNWLPQWVKDLISFSTGIAVGSSGGTTNNNTSNQNNTFNITGSAYDIEQTILRILRQNGSRYNL